METLVEIMGTQQMQDLRLASYSESLLDSSHIQPTALSVIGKAKQHKTFSPSAWSPAIPVRHSSIFEPVLFGAQLTCEILCRMAKNILEKGAKTE